MISLCKAIQDRAGSGVRGGSWATRQKRVVKRVSMLSDARRTRVKSRNSFESMKIARLQMVNSPLTSLGWKESVRKFVRIIDATPYLNQDYCRCNHRKIVKILHRKSLSSKAKLQIKPSMPTTKRPMSLLNINRFTISSKSLISYYQTHSAGEVHRMVSLVYRGPKNNKMIER